MNLKTKGAIAAGAATVLLAGGAGTMAAFNGGGSVGGGAVGAGSLSLAQSGTPSWSDQFGPVNITNYKAVPGDVLTYKASFTVTAKGTNLIANLGADSGTITGDAALKAAMKSSVTATTGGASLPSNAGGTVITPAQDGKVVDVKVIFTFAPSTSGATAQTARLDLSNFNITLKQV
ncbi:alternate-type signal peptide domain-containing protein [Rhodococcus spelaei]|uniref:Alternate-type signal peptide domain-containing protein n=1 Tax=Rhodococcus spelaei TaxID=2546320 RepID=A0A541B9Q9_9NOCA|nr:alternate-type signal peptide domain-containing protein [Rhodococcus spelaei]TQF69066.1 alternate-type signal peptide domain-containing protein [Rhodococcus spelaei]